MLIVEVRHGGAGYALYADLDAKGDLLLSGSDIRAPGSAPPSDSDGYGRRSGYDEYEYCYRVAAADVPRVCELLRVPREQLLDGMRALLAPHGITAGSVWRKWLESNHLEFAFTVR